MSNFWFFFLIIFLEGYAVLSAELLAIRQLVPYVGSATDTVSIVIAAVLMPLAFGYEAGGRFKRRHENGSITTVRKKLLSNILVATVFLFCGLSHIIIEMFFNAINAIGIEYRLLMTTAYCVVFLVVPVFLLAQTIPLVSHFLQKEKLSRMTGKMLFFSTLGSFMGAVFSTLVLMAFLGVHYTALVTIASLVVLYILLSKNKFSLKPVLMMLLLVVAVAINNGGIMHSLGIVENNQYNTVAIEELNYGHTRVMRLNRNKSALYTDKKMLTGINKGKQGTFGYVDYINRHFITPILKEEKAYEILVIGAGGFTLGVHDKKNHYTYVEIDKALEEVSEEYLLKHELGENKTVIAEPARGYLHQAVRKGKKFDLIILDTYKGAKIIPQHHVTEEFFQDTKDVLADDGIMIANYIISGNFASAFSYKVDNTIRKIFPNISRHIVSKKYNGWDTKKMANVLYIYNNHGHATDDIYTDNLNRAYSDRRKEVY